MSKTSLSPGGATTSALPTHKTSPAVKVIYTAISLFIILIIIRANILGHAWRSPFALTMYFPKSLLSAYYDFRFVLVITLFFGLLIFLLKSRPRYQQVLYYLFALVALISAVAAILNERTIRIIGSPFSYQWLYYSDFMGSTDSKNAMLANVSWKLSAVVLIALVLMFLMAKLLWTFHNYLIKSRSIGARQAFIIFLVFAVCYSLAFNWYKDRKKWQYNLLANPVTFFLESVIKTDKSSLLFSMKVPGKFEDLPDTKMQALTSIPAGIKNVVFFVLESVPAQYLDQYGGKYNISPEISKLLPNSMLFTNAYAHSPSTNNAMVSILGSIYPWISYKSLTREYPDIRLNSISHLLKKSGYRTAFYNSGDLNYQRANEFLLNQGFDQVEDFSSKFCKDRQFIVQGKRWDNPDGSDDDCIVDAFSEWVDSGDEPFFATLWSVQTHYPYFYSGKEKDYQVNNSDFNRYLNALRHTDKTLGNLMAALKSRGLEESTLIVIVGDHGEAFGQHQQSTHASKIYEENIHVPLILVNKRLFSGEKNDIISGQIDIAPTVMNILQLPVNKNWQGQNLLVENQNKRTYFFAPWSDFLFGYREGRHKFIYNATKDLTEVYDLGKDPLEKVNIAADFPEDFLSNGQKRLATWIQYQNNFIKESVSNNRQN